MNRYDFDSHDDYIKAKEAEEKRRFKFKLGLIGAGVGIIFAFILILSMTVRVEPGYNAVIYSANGGLEEKTLNQGWHFIAPWKKAYDYPVSTETVYLTSNKIDGSKEDESMNVNTKDGKSVNVDITYAYHMEPTKLPHIFTKFRRQTAFEISNTYMKQQLKTSIQSITTRYSVLDVYGEKRAEITLKVEEEFAKNLEKDGIILENFAFSDIRPDAKTLEAIQAIVNAQNAEQLLKQEEKNKRQQAINDKIAAEGQEQVALVQARQKAEEKRIAASANADATLTEAEATAEANRKISASLDKNIIQYELIKQLPHVTFPKVMGSDGNIMQFSDELLK